MQKIMKRLGFVLALALALVLAGCPGAGPSTTPPGAPAAISVAGARGVYLQSAPAAKLAGAPGARAALVSEGAELGAVTADGVPETATFVDAEGATVTVTITEAAELAPGYVLVAYDYAGGSATAVLDLASGGLKTIDRAPGDWARIFARGSQAWYVSDGAIVRLDLASGETTEISAGARVWRDDGAYMTPNIDQGYSEPWPSSTWVYVDAAGTVYGICLISSPHFQAQAITAAGAVADFGDEEVALNFYGILPGVSVSAKYAHALYDEASGRVYIVRGGEIWDGDPMAPGGMTPTGYALRLFPVVFDPSKADVLSFNLGAPAAYAVMDGATTFTTTYVGRGFLMDASVLSFGSRTYKAGASAISSYDTSAVPVSRILPSGATDGSFVANWRFSGGEVYAGPTDTSSAISVVDFSTSTAALKTLLTDSGITRWTVVGGVLFYTNATGTYRAEVDAVTGTLGTVAPYEGGPVEAVTQ